MLLQSLCLYFNNGHTNIVFTLHRECPDNFIINTFRSRHLENNTGGLCQQNFLVLKIDKKEQQILFNRFRFAC